MILRRPRHARPPLRRGFSAIGVEMLRLPTPCGRRVRGIVRAGIVADGAITPDAPTRPTLLFFYGNGMYLNETVPLMQHLRRIGRQLARARVPRLRPERRPRRRKGCYATADAAWQHLHSAQRHRPIPHRRRRRRWAAPWRSTWRRGGASRRVHRAGTFTSIPDVAATSTPTCRSTG
jgi:hypothetical protein